jgi:hypothetical protein
MPTVQELFKAADGSKILDNKIAMVIASLPTEPVTKTLPTGKEITYFDVKMDLDGSRYTWECDPKQFAQRFVKSDKTGKEYWRAHEGEIVNVWYASNKTTPSRPYYAVEPAVKDQSVGMPAAFDVFDDGEMVAHVTAPAAAAQPVTSPVPYKQKFAPSTRAEQPKWDGSPRQSSFRQGLAGMLQAILSNPNINPLEESNIEAAKNLAEQLVKYVRVEALRLESEIKE